MDLFPYNGDYIFNSFDWGNNKGAFEMKLLKQFFKGFKEGFKDFGHSITIIINSILLSVVYIFGVGITSVFAKIFGKHFLDTKISKKRKTYWQDLNLKKESIDKYYRQF